MKTPATPVCGFRVWKVAKPLRRGIQVADESVYVPIDPGVSVGHLVGDPEIAEWLAKHARAPRPKRSWKFVQPEREVGTLLTTAWERDDWAAPGPVQFECRCARRGPDGKTVRLLHPRPTIANHCGLHAWFTVEQACDMSEAGADSVLGAVVAWGSLALHGIEGFRAEWARIVALSPPPPKHASTTVSPRWARLAAERLGVPCVPLDRLEQVAREHGSLIRWEYRFE